MTIKVKYLQGNYRTVQSSGPKLFLPGPVHCASIRLFLFMYFLVQPSTMLRFSLTFDREHIFCLKIIILRKGALTAALKCCNTRSRNVTLTLVHAAVQGPQPHFGNKQRWF